MALTPGALGRRYAPFLAIAAVQVLLVAMTPSRPQTVQAEGGPATATGNVASGVDAAGNPVAVDAAGNPVSTVGGALGPSGTSTGALGVTGSTLPGGRVVNPKLDLSHCDSKGRQIGWSYYMPLCAPVWHGGDNGGATMPGVSATEIKYVFYVAKGDPQVNAILAREGLAASTEQTCQRLKALDAAINKRWEFYGRKAVSLDGPHGPNSGTEYQANQQRNAPNDGGPCRFPVFQGNCTLTPPDAPCERAEAKVIAQQLKPAYVMAPVAASSFFDELAYEHIVVSGGEAEPAAYHSQYPGYYYDVFMDGTRAAEMIAEYWCKKLNGKPVQFAGPKVMHPDNNPLSTPPTRKLGMIWPENPSDPDTFTNSVNHLRDLITGKVKGRGCTTSTEIVTQSYLSDINKAQDQARTTIDKFSSKGVTTMMCLCDPIAPVFLTANADSQQYYPEHFMTGTGLIDYDVLGRLYTPAEWRNAFGLSHLQVSLPFDQTDATKAWRDAGNTGQPDPTSNLSTAYFSLMASSFQAAGPKLTAANMQQGLFTAPVRGGWQETGGNPAYPKIKFAAPDDYTGINDAREVWWCANRRSEIDGQPGSYVPVDRGHRYDLGEWPTGDPAVFVGESSCPRAG